MYQYFLSRLYFFALPPYSSKATIHGQPGVSHRGLLQCQQPRNLSRRHTFFPFFSLPAWIFIDPGKLDSGWLCQMFQIPLARLYGLQHLTTASMGTTYEFRLEWFHADDCTIRPSATTDNSRTRQCATAVSEQCSPH